jgi:hypothetical protein
MVGFSGVRETSQDGTPRGLGKGTPYGAHLFA